MSSISGVGSSSHAWTDISSSRQGAMKAKMFGKADADGSGGVDQTELQNLFDKVATKTGASATSASEQFGKMDADGDGSLSSDELSSGMKSLMPPPRSTVDFAQRRGDDGGSEAAVNELFSNLDADSSGDLNATELKALTDRMAADLSGSTGTDNSASSAAAAAVFKALDKDEDGAISKGELTAAVSSKQGGDLSAQGMPPGPPPGGPPPAGGGGGGGSASASSTSSNSTTYDPLDTNEDGVVSAQERAAGVMKDLLKTLTSAMDSNQDGDISKSEVDGFATQLASAFSGSAASAETTSAPGGQTSSDSSAPSGGERQGLDFRALQTMVRQAYSQAVADSDAPATAGVSLSA
jgi:Ca2+-binding EF-hand superfamily protein